VIGIALHFLEEGESGGTLVGANQLDELGATGNGLEQADQLGGINREQLRIGVLPVKDGGHALDLAQTTRGRERPVWAREATFSVSLLLIVSFPLIPRLIGGQA
jgi:hypothetical protein